MKKKVLAICLLCFLIATISAQLSWPEALPIADYNNIGFDGKVVRTGDGITVLLYSAFEDEANQTYMQAYDQNNQAFWASPVALEGSLGANNIFLTDQSILVVISFRQENSSRSLYQNRYNLNGLQLGTSNTVVMHNYVGFLKLYTDRQGGIHVFGTDYNTTRYQHINADGSLQHPVYGASLPGIPTDSHLYKSLVCNDGSLLISYSNNNTSGIFKMDSALNVLFSYSFAIDNANCYYGWCAMRSDDGFYLFREEGAICKLYSYNSSGETLWTEPVQLAEPFRPDIIVCDSLDRALICGAVSLEYYLRIFDNQGNSLYAEPGLLLFDLITEYPNTKMFMNGADGFYLLKKYSNDFQGQDSLQYINLLSSSSPWELNLGNLETNLNLEPYHAVLEQGVFKIWHYLRTEENSGIVLNAINQTGTQEFPNPGCFLESGACGEISLAVIRPLGQDRALATWAVTIQDNPELKILKYNLIQPGGFWGFNEGQILVSNPQVISDLQCFSTDDGCALVVWGVNRNDFYAQKIDRFGSTLWPQAKHLLSGLQNQRLCASYYENSLYICYYPSSGATIRMQRYLEGEPLWGPDGVIVASNSVGYPDLAPAIQFLNDRTVIWSVTDNDASLRMCYFNSVDQNGQSLPGFSSSGLPVNILPDDYVGFGIHRVSRGGNRLWLELSLAQSVWIPEGHSSGYWGMSYTPVIQAVTDEGQIVFPNGGISSSYSLGSLADETGYYKCSEYYSDHLRIAKYDLAGNLLWQQDPLSEMSWYMDWYYGDFGISLQKVSETEILALGATYTDTSSSFTYFSFSPQGQFTIPGDTIIQSSAKTELTCALTNTRMGTYFLMATASGSYAGIQFRASGAELGIDENSPAHMIVSASPNPFNQDLKLELNLERPGYAKLEIFNLRGQMVLNREYHELEAGRNLIIWDGKDDTKRNCSSGIYFIRLTDGKHTDIIKTVRLK